MVTFDEDFRDLQLINGYPPKIIWLRFGNTRNVQLIIKLIAHQSHIATFTENPEARILELY
jgi:predicted nuclease of predicted toxin-antitoxin system